MDRNITTYQAENINQICDFLASKDADLKGIIVHHGYPKLGSRKSGFAAIVRLILEQQVSLMSARAAYSKLQNHIMQVTPEGIMKLSDAELRACYFSRQKAGYVRALAQAFIDKRLVTDELDMLTDDEIRKKLMQIKGIGAWTADNYLLLCLRRTDIFPIGDIALINSIRKIKRFPANIRPEKILKLAESWRPYRSIATQLFWHAYIIDRKIDVAALDY